MLSRAALLPLFRVHTHAHSAAGARNRAVLSSAPLFRNLALALVVAIGYYVGSQIGFLLTPAEMPISTFWPPNAILLAAFLLTRPRIWWVLVLAVFPAHLLIQLKTGIPVLSVLGWFLGNTGEALLGAAGIRFFKKAEPLFDNVHGLVVFLVFGVLLATLLTSFPDAASAIHAEHGRNYWMLWTTRFTGNMVSDVTIVPILVILGMNGLSGLRKVNFARYFEAGTLALGVGVVSLLAFSGDNTGRMVPAFIYAPLPLLLWAALRFGSGGLGACLLGVALISARSVLHGALFGGLSTEQQTLSLHIWLLAVALPLFLTAALIAERRTDKQILQNTRSKLIYAQERERHRIGRELHEDVSQRLTLVGLGIDALRAGPDASAKAPLNRLYDQISEAFTTALHLSHRVYPFMVEYLGLTAALRKLCRETGTESGMTMNWSIEEVPTELPSDVPHRLYRVAQDALQDIVQRGHAKTVAVELRVGDGRVLLRITDDGAAMDPQRGEGVGVTYMREQVLSLGGTFKIMSTPTSGTIIEASAPSRKSPA